MGELAMGSLLLHSSTMAQWQALVKDAELMSHLTLDKELESYLVFLLGRFNQRPDIANCILATEFLSGLEKSPVYQRDCLREVGDKCLLFAGFFPEQAEKRHVKIKYFIELGRTAYVQVASLSKKRSATLYHSLSCGFISLMEVLHAIRGLSDPMNELSPLQAFELWTDVKSQHALAVLKRRTSGLIIRGISNKN
ncbi:hypothetical protein [Rickettsiella endosymbiont of Dermanyssus gallinae]|uniref:hypothetical protein n=1 Tax=Rickettsiella endosymbiont of Dermanyssus gallinae TaxID=2856608 RepID=UPI001FEB5FB0|nr:hypothetical protein [Rickettsiella endosymbiont of Dermanyssus gallinae]